MTDSPCVSPRTPRSALGVRTRQDFERLLVQEHGLKPSFDPRLKQALDERLAGKEFIDDNDVRAFAKSSSLLSRALRGKLIVPNYKQWATALDEAFVESIDARSDDADNNGLGVNARYIPPLADVGKCSSSVADGWLRWS